LHRRLVIFITVISLIMRIIPVGTAASEADDAVPIRYIDFSSTESFSAYSEVYKHTPTAVEPDPNTAGVFYFDSTEKALKLSYAPTEMKAPWRIIFKTKAAHSSFPYAVVVYKAKCKSDARISLWNSPMQGIEAVFCEKASDTGGKWAVSEPVKIDTSTSPNIMSRMQASAPTNIYVDCADANAVFHIKELTFFKTAEDAKRYYSSRDLGKPVSDHEFSNDVLSAESVSELEFIRPTYEKITPETLNYSFDNADELAVFDGKISHTGQSVRIEDGLIESRIYEADTELTWAFTFEGSGELGVMLRRNNEHSYTSLIIDIKNKTAAVKMKPTMNTSEIALSKCDLTLLEGHLYVMKLSLVGEKLILCLGGDVILETDGVFVTSPGKVAFYAEDAVMDIYELDVTLMTEVGRIMGEGTFNETVLMRRGGESNYRIPALISTNSGTLIAAANDRRNTLSDRADEQWLVIRRKEVDGDWEDIRVLAATEGMSHAIGNIIYDDVNDVIYIHYLNSPSDAALMNYIATGENRGLAVSRDDGVTWEIKEIDILPNEDGLACHTHGSASGFVLKYGEHAGRIISPARTAYDYTEGQTTLQTMHYNCTLYSDDGGVTWQTGGTVQPGTGEGTLIEREDGVIMFNSRAYFLDHYRRIAYSCDGGETFTDFGVETALLEPMNGVNASFLRTELANGQVITLFANPYVEGDMVGTGTRKNLTICVSYDEGRTWVTKKTAHAAYSSYSCLTYNPVTETFFMLYEGGDTVYDTCAYISVIEFDLDWLLK